MPLLGSSGSSTTAGSVMGADATSGEGFDLAAETFCCVFKRDKTPLNHVFGSGLLFTGVGAEAVALIIDGVGVGGRATATTGATAGVGDELRLDSRAEVWAEEASAWVSSPGVISSVAADVSGTDVPGAEFPARAEISASPAASLENICVGDPAMISISSVIDVFAKSCDDASLEASKMVFLALMDVGFDSTGMVVCGELDSDLSAETVSTRKGAAWVSTVVVGVSTGVPANVDGASWGTGTSASEDAKEGSGWVPELFIVEWYFSPQVLGRCEDDQRSIEYMKKWGL